MNNKKIAIIGTVGIPAQYGGFETLAENLTIYLNDKFDITIFCSGKTYLDQPSRINGAKLIYLPLQANGIQSIPYDVLAILKSLRTYDTLLILGVSGCVILPFIKPFCRGKIIVNIDGLEWKRDKWRSYARWFLKISEKIAVRFADTVIADNKVIQQHVRNSYGKSSELIAYGADHVSALPLTNAIKQQFPFLQNPYAFSVCRIEPENNIHLILEAFANTSQLPLVLIGNWKANHYGLTLLKQYESVKHLHLLDPIYDPAQLNPIRANCTVYVHGHSAGGTNPSLVEAMYLQLPIMAFDIHYNRETTENNAIYFLDVQQLTHLLNSLETLQLPTIATNMHNIALRRYRWQVIADHYAALF